MKTEDKKTNTQIKVNTKIYKMFTSHAYWTDQSLPEALEEAMTDYNNKRIKCQGKADTPSTV